jgi:hypothetical protein
LHSFLDFIFMLATNFAFAHFTHKSASAIFLARRNLDEILLLYFDFAMLLCLTFYCCGFCLTGQNLTVQLCVFLVVALIDPSCACCL